VLPAGSPPRDEGNLNFVFSVPAWDAVIAGGRVITLDADFKSLSGYSTADGRWQWKTQLDGTRSGRHSLAIRRGAVHLWAGNRIYIVDPATGAVSPPAEAPWNNDCAFAEHGSACAFECSCSIALADCSTGRQIGKTYEMSRIEFHASDDEGGSSSSCSRWGVGLVTGTKSTAILTVENDKSKVSGAFIQERVAVGLDAATGKEIWRSPELALAGTFLRGGSSLDEKTCWTAGGDGDIRAFECATGSILWKKAGKANSAGPKRALVSIVAERGAVFRLHNEAAELFDLRSGAALWKVAVRAPNMAIPRSAPIAFYDIVTSEDSPITVRILRPSDGATETLIAVPGGGRVDPDPGGGFYVIGFEDELRAFDTTGQERWRDVHKGDPPNPVFHEDFFALFGGERLVLFDRRDGRRIGEIAGDLGVQAGSSLQRGVLLYRFEDRGKKIGQAIFVREIKR
jgi:outer membrane protein assembly factor BamB